MPRFSRSSAGLGVAAAALATLLAGSPAAAGSQGANASGVQVDNWTTYHYSLTRHGYDSHVPLASGPLRTAWTARLDGAVYAEPLVVFGKIVAVTENDTVYALSLKGRVLWKRHLGSPVPGSELPCGDIDPLGITGTPIYRPSTHEVYVAAELDHPIRHRLFAVNPTTGHVDWSRSVDPAGMDASVTQERGALTIADGRVWVPFGGLYGDCGPYHGWLIGSPLSGRGPLTVYKQPSAREAGIWAPSGPAVDRHGHLYVAIGNGAATSPPYDESDSILELAVPGRNPATMSVFAPKDWAYENAHDLDLGSTGPILFPALHRFWAFGDGKAGDGYLLRQDHLGGIGHPAATIHDCASWSGTAFRLGVVFVPCSSGLSAYRVVTGPRLSKVWSNPSVTYGAAPVVGGGAVWAVSDGRLFRIGRVTGHTLASVGVGSTPHFATPTLHGNLALVGTTSGVVAVRTS